MTNVNRPYKDFAGTWMDAGNKIRGRYSKNHRMVSEQPRMGEKRNQWRLPELLREHVQKQIITFL